LTLSAHTGYIVHSISMLQFKNEVNENADNVTCL